jgi:hypothetical protein
MNAWTITFNNPITLLGESTPMTAIGIDSVGYNEDRQQIWAETKDPHMRLILANGKTEYEAAGDTWGDTWVEAQIKNMAANGKLGQAYIKTIPVLSVLRKQVDILTERKANNLVEIDSAIQSRKTQLIAQNKIIDGMITKCQAQIAAKVAQNIP